MSEHSIMGVKMTHIGVKPPKEEPAKQPVQERKERFPSLYLSGEQIPEALANKEKGMKCIIVCIANVASRTERDEKDKDKELSMEIELMKMGVTSYKDKKAKDMDDEELEEGIKQGKGSKDDEE